MRLWQGRLASRVRSAHGSVAAEPGVPQVREPYLRCAAPYGSTGLRPWLMLFRPYGHARQAKRTCVAPTGLIVNGLHVPGLAPGATLCRPSGSPEPRSGDTM